MSEEMNIQPEEVVVPSAAESESSGGVAKSSDVPAALREVDPAKLAEIREKLGRFMEKKGKTVSGSEDPDSAPKVDQEGRGLGEVMKGSDVDWSEYDLNFSVQHLYQRAMFRETSQGPKWVAMLDEFYSTEKDSRSHGRKVNVPGTTDGQETEPLNLGEYLTETVNGPEGWEIGAIMPAASGKSSVLLRRKTAYVLPDPKPLRRTEEVEAPKDQELQVIEDAALAFAKNEGLAPPAEEVPTMTDLMVAPEAIEEDLSSRFLTREQAGDALGEDGVIEARGSSLVRQALEAVKSLQIAAPVPTGIQPEAMEDESGRKHAAGVVNIAAGMRKILSSPDFGTV